MTLPAKLDFEHLQALARASATVAAPCACGIAHHIGWTRVPVSFPEDRMHTVGTLVDDPYVEASFAEYHPHRTNYWSPEAPIAPRHFPYNRCTLQQCADCGRCCLRYVEAGGYYVEPRIRALQPGLLMDAAL